MTPFLSRADIAVLNAAREILIRASKDAMRLSFDIASGFDAAGAGRAAHAADVAEFAIFDCLSTAKHYGDQAITETQLHNVTEAVAQ